MWVIYEGGPGEVGIIGVVASIGIIVTIVVMRAH